MKKVIAVSLIIFIIIMCFVGYTLLFQRIETEFATKYCKIFGSYDIDQVDAYLNEATVITFKEESKTYKELRDNIITAFEKKDFEMKSGSSYGNGDGKFIGGTHEIDIQSYVHYGNKGSREILIIMQIEMKGINKFSIKSIKSNDEFFGYLFFGIMN